MAIIHDQENKAFVLHLEDGQKAIVNYTFDSCSGMRLVHSEVPYSLRGKGIGKKLILETFEKLTEEGFEATAVCNYIRVVAKRHPKWKTIIN